jgi:CRP-like cAMP-binding protein
MMGLEPQRTATVVARTDCELLCLDHKDMLVVFRNYPEVMEHIIEGARQKYKELKQIDEEAFSPKPQFKVKRRVSVAFNSPHELGKQLAGLAPFSKTKSSKPKESRDDDNRASELFKQLESRLDRKQQAYSQELRSTIEDVQKPVSIVV